MAAPTGGERICSTRRARTAWWRPARCKPAAHGGSIHRQRRRRRQRWWRPASFRAADGRRWLRVGAIGGGAKAARRCTLGGIRFGTRAHGLGGGAARLRRYRRAACAQAAQRIMAGGRQPRGRPTHGSYRRYRRRQRTRRRWTRRRWTRRRRARQQQRRPCLLAFSDAVALALAGAALLAMAAARD